MASFFPFGRIKYSDYLQAEFFVRDITGTIKRVGDESAKLAVAVARSGAASGAAISNQTSAIVASNEALRREFDGGFDAVNSTIDWGFNFMSQGLDVRSSIEELGATFSYNLGLMIAQLQVQNRLMLGVVEQFDAIHKTSENPTLTQAREFYRIGCERLERGLLDKALEAFHKSEEKNDTDFLTQLQLGRIYLYGKDDDDNVIDLEKARVHLRRAARYGKAELAFLPDAAASTGEASLHAAIACYLTASEAKLADDEAVSHERLEESVRLALEAGKLRPELGEAHYQAASALVLLARSDEATASLERAVAADRRYSLRAMEDPIFGSARGALVGRLERLRADALSRAQDLLAARRRWVGSFVFVGDKGLSVRAEIESHLGTAEQMIAQGALFDCQDAIRGLSHVSVLSLRWFATLKDHRIRVDSVAFSPDGAVLASAHMGGVNLWDVRGRQLLATLEGHPEWGLSVAFSPDGSLLASGNYDRTVTLWDVRGRRLLATLEGRSESGYSVAFSPDGSLLASGGFGGCVKLWDVREQRLLGTIEGVFSLARSIAFSPDGSLLASGGHGGTVKFWDVREQRLLATLEGHSESVCSVAFSPDGSLLASGSDDMTVKLWDVYAQRLLDTLEGHTREVTSVTFSPDGTLLASGSEDTTVKLWDVFTRRLLDTLEEHTKEVTSVTFSPDGTLLASGSRDKSVELCHILPEGVFPRAGWERTEAARAEREREAELLKREREAEAAALNQKEKEAAELRRLQEERRSKGLCRGCGVRLGFLQRLAGNKQCRNCSRPPS